MGDKMEEKETIKTEIAALAARNDKKISEMSVLFPLLTIYTIAYLGLMIYDFVAKEAFTLPSEIMYVYIALLGAYATDKEIRRWVGSSFDSKFGSVFVYLWLLFFLAAFIIKSFKTQYALPNDLLKVSLEVLGVFFGSKASKKIYEVKNKGSVVISPDSQDIVKELLTAKGKIERKDVELALKVSKATAARILDEMEKKGAIKHEGEGKGTHYIIANNA